MKHSPQAYRQQAHAALLTGDVAQAEHIYREALSTWPSDPVLWNSAGNTAMRGGNATLAEERFAHAQRLEPDNLEFCVNRAIALGRIGAAAKALALLEDNEDTALRQRDARYCSVRAGLMRDIGRLDDSAKWYDVALSFDSHRPIAANGRARVALERSEPGAVSTYDRALALTPSNPELWLGKAQALDGEGRTEEARALAEALVAQTPHWVDALRFLAQLRHSAGDPDFAAPFARAEECVSTDPAIRIAHCVALAGVDRFAEAADVAARARKAFPDDERFAMLEAVHAGEAGDWNRANAIWHATQTEGPHRDLQEARHWLRANEAERAAGLLERAIAMLPGNVAAWALLGVAWRILGDPRAAWLHQQEGLVQFLPLRDADTLLPLLMPALHHLHDESAAPLGQSLRGGTQTRGGLFARHEPIYARLSDSVTATLEDYREALPALDRDHPLLALRDVNWRIAGSWSVRLSGGGDFHTSHIHSHGRISSALYLEVPDEVDDAGQPGWLEIGRPPADLGLEIPPLSTIRPMSGYLALFPSTLYHGTRPFGAGTRLTVAFDVDAPGG